MMTLARTALPAGGKRGAILVGVLWILIFVAFLAVVLRVHMGSVVASVRVTEDKAAARIIAEAGLARAAALVLAAPFSLEGAAADQIQDEIETATGRVSIRMTNEAWRIDLNTGERPLIVGALRAAGAPPALADTLATRILERRPAEGTNPEGGDPPMPQKATGGNPLQTVAEVAMIEGMPDNVALGLRAYSTVSSGLKGVRLEQLNDALLREIPGLPTSVISDIARFRRGEISREQLDQSLTGVEFYSSEKALSWRVLLDVELPSGHAESHEALIMISPDDDAPYRVLDWRRVTGGLD